MSFDFHILAFFASCIKTATGSTFILTIRAHNSLPRMLNKENALAHEHMTFSGLPWVGCSDCTIAFSSLHSP